MHLHGALLFFGLTSYLYLVSGLLFPTASFFASNAITDKATASAVMSFINIAPPTVLKPNEAYVLNLKMIMAIYLSCIAITRIGASVAPETFIGKDAMPVEPSVKIIRRPLNQS